ncbi:MAG TPA: hypothetical protein VN066_04555 [Rhodocyclaceae bacterium]|nr:hypothetical protein [Rhodocyclaceae bacterium]
MAMWAPLSDDELIRSADLIVVGEWQGQVAVSTAGNPEMELGVVLVSESWKGGSPAVVLVALPPSRTPRSSSDPVFRRGDRGLWLLRLQPGSKGLYLVDHPQRFVSSTGGEQRIRQLRQLIKP